VLGELERAKVNAATRQQQLLSERDEAVRRATALDAQLKALQRELDALEVGADAARDADDADGGGSSVLTETQLTAERAKRLAAIDALPASDARRAQLLLELEARCHESAAALQRERSARRLKQLELEQIYREIQAKAPIIAQQRAEYERVARAHVALAAALEAAVADSERHRARADELERENAGAAAVRADLDSQVQRLLAHVEAMRRGDAAGAAASDDGITFDSIAELQQTNVALLERVRTLEAAASADARAAADLEVSAALDELGKLRQTREQQATLVQAIAQQRDMYRALLARADAKHASLAGARDDDDDGDAARDPGDESGQARRDADPRRVSLGGAASTAAANERAVVRCDVHDPWFVDILINVTDDAQRRTATNARRDGDCTTHCQRVGRPGERVIPRCCSLRVRSSLRAMLATQRALRCACVTGSQRR
jgi:hypothetical protein